MKKIFLFIAFLFSALHVSAQDLIVKNSGESVKAYNLEIAGSSLFFQLTADPNAPVQKLPKTEVLIIKKADGTKIDLDAPAAQPAAQQAVQQQSATQNQGGVVMQTLDMLSPEEKAENQRMIEQLNGPITYNVTKDKKALSLCGRFSPKQSSIVSNKDISISLVSGSMFAEVRNGPETFEETNPISPTWLTFLGHKAGRIAISITNNSNQTIYVDLGNTMVVAQGHTIALYVPQSTTVSNTTVAGGSLNLGAMTGSRLLGGVIVGGSNASTTVSTVYAQRVIAVAPHSTIRTQPVVAWEGEQDGRYITQGIKWFRGNFKGWMKLNSLMVLNSDDSYYCGQLTNFSEENSPLDISAYVSYSYTEDCAQEKTMPVHYYLKDFVGYGQSQMGRAHVQFTNFPGMCIPFLNGTAE